MSRSRERRPALNRGRAKGGRLACTLIELSIVILIMGILIAFVLTATAQSVRRADVRATQATITKLEVGLNDRLQALLSAQIIPNGAHSFLGATYPIPPEPPAMPWGLPSGQRAAVIAQLDMIKAELPDVFYVVPATDPYYNAEYPLNFAGLPYPL